MDGSKIVRHIHYHIVKKYLEGHVWCVDEIISFMAVAIFPYPSKSIDSKNTCYGDIEDMCEMLNGYLGRGKKLKQEISTYSYNSLKQYFNDKFVVNLSWNTKEHIVNCLKIASSIENDGFISIRYSSVACDAVLRSYKEFEVLESSSYGYVEYIPVLQVDKQDKNDSVVVEDTPSNKISTPDNAIPHQVGTKSLTESSNAENLESNGHTKTSKTLKSLEKTPSIEKGNNKTDLSPAVVLNPEEEKLNSLWENIGYDETKMPYVWKLRISYEKYKRLKECLINCIKSLPSGYGVLPRFLKIHYIKFFVYIAEWYKWEYTPDSKTNALKDIGNKVGPERIWDKCPELWCNNFLYTANVNHAKEFSIYALGGLPLKAIFNNDRIDAFFEKVSEENNCDIIIETLDNAINGLSNAFKQSLADSQGSWNLFVREINESPSLLYAEDDKQDNELVKFFYKRLADGRRQSVDNSIKYNWILYTSPDSEDIAGDIVVQIGKNKDKGCIAAEVVNSVENDLYIGIESQGEILKYRRFSKGEGDKYFIGWGSISNRFRGYVEDLSQEIRLCKYKLSNIMSGEGELLRTFTLGDEYIILYDAGDGCTWSTLEEYRKNTKAVIFPIDRYTVIGELGSLQKKNINGKTWLLCEITDSIQIKDDCTGKVHDIFCTGEIAVKVPLQTETIRYYGADNSLVKCAVKDETVFLPLMIGVPKGNAIKLYSSMESCRCETRRFKDVCAEYIKNRQRAEFTNDTPIGIILLDINIGKYSLKKKYFYLPPGSICRDVILNKIFFNNIKEACIYRVLTDGALERLENNFYQDDIKEFLIDDTLRFRIYSSSEEYVELDIYRPIKRRELSFNQNLTEEHYGHQFDNRIEIPYILRDKFVLRVFDDNGVNRPVYLKKQRWFKIGHPATAQLVQDGFNIYMYRDFQVRNAPIGTLNIYDKCVEQYKFFYWSVKLDAEPEQIDVSYDKTTRQLFVSQDRLNRKSGMIFQSLKDNTPRHYAVPLYKERWTTLVDRIYDDDLFFKCYCVAVEHKVPFTQFYPLHKAVTNIEWIKKLLGNIVNSTLFDEKDVYVDLHRFANEFCFEWLLLPKNFWSGFDRAALRRPPPSVLQQRKHPHPVEWA